MLIRNQLLKILRSVLKISVFKELFDLNQDAGRGFCDYSICIFSTLTGTFQIPDCAALLAEWTGLESFVHFLSFIGNIDLDKSLENVQIIQNKNSVNQLSD